MASPVQSLVRFLKDYKNLRRGLPYSESGSSFKVRPNFPVFRDFSAPAGEMTGHYFHQDLLVARQIFEARPRRHIDIGSAIHGFVAHVASFREIEVMDIRPGSISRDHHITFIQRDLMAPLGDFREATDSLSCLHTLEHLGLGRYGDAVDPDAWLKGLSQLKRILEPGGTLYLSVPTGTHQRIDFNAHRVFTLPYFRNTLLSDFSIQNLAFVDDTGDLHPSVDPFGSDAEQSFKARYGLSIWTLARSHDGI